MRDNSESDFITRANQRRGAPGAAAGKEPKKSISQLIQRKAVRRQSKHSMFSEEMFRLVGKGKGKYRNDAIFRILNKRKREISQSFSSPNNVLPEKFAEDLLATSKKPLKRSQPTAQAQPRGR